MDTVFSHFVIKAKKNKLGLCVCGDSDDMGLGGFADIPEPENRVIISIISYASCENILFRNNE